MNKTFCFSLTLILLFQLILCNAQNSESLQAGIMFYNVENLFDTKHDSLKNDYEFLPNGSRFWNGKKYNQKLKNIGNVIFESGEWNLPSIIGLCEVENETTLKGIIFENGLDKLKYSFIHFESKDKRGIDVAMLYRRDDFTVLESSPIFVDLNDQRPTRDILYVYGILHEKTPLHLFVCHFPSRYGGVMESAPKRMLAAKTLCDTIKNIQIQDSSANIVVMGDFNDNPEDKSMKYIEEETELVNLASSSISLNNTKGTIKHKFEWHFFDQFLVSKSLLNKTNKGLVKKEMKIIDKDFLLESDTNNSGKKPFRTYIGFKYNNGYSDHLPIWINIEF